MQRRADAVPNPADAGRLAGLRLPWCLGSVPGRCSPLVLKRWNSDLPKSGRPVSSTAGMPDPQRGGPARDRCLCGATTSGPRDLPAPKIPTARRWEGWPGSRHPSTRLVVSMWPEPGTFDNVALPPLSAIGRHGSARRRSALMSAEVDPKRKSLPHSRSRPRSPTLLERTGNGTFSTAQNVPRTHTADHTVHAGDFAHAISAADCPFVVESYVRRSLRLRRRRLLNSTDRMSAVADWAVGVAIPTGPMRQSS